VNWPQDKIGSLGSLGYTEIEARFLYLVAIHSGYFTRQHFLDFSGAHRGQRSFSFTQKLLRHGHASMRDYMGTGSVFHLFSNSVYGRLEKENNPNRRRHSFEYIRTRLVLLDFVLEHLDCDFLETERDKVRFFCETLGVSKDVLPAKVYERGTNNPSAIRYFVDRFPIFLTPQVLASRPVATFTYVDSGYGSIAHFGVHIAAYQALFRRLAAFHFVYVAPRTSVFARAENKFRSFVKEPREIDGSTEILRYFLVRQKWERHEYVVPVADDLEFLSEARRHFDGDRFESLYKAWVAGRVDEPALRAEFAHITAGRKVSFDTYLVQTKRLVDERHKKHVKTA
jgi:hypothetical protein